MNLSFICLTFLVFRLWTVNYSLNFSDRYGRVRDVCKAEIATEAIAICWMRIVGAVWAGHRARSYDLSYMELWCEGRCIAWGKPATLDLKLDS